MELTVMVLCGVYLFGMLSGWTITETTSEVFGILLACSAGAAIAGILISGLIAAIGQYQ